MAAVPLYDDLGADYDRFVDWEGRLALELPAIEKVLGRIGARSLLDAACGTGRHAIALARKGYRVVGADLSTAMLECARQNAREAGVGVSFIQAGLGKLARHLAGPFDAVLCLGHSLPHLLSAAEVEAALRDFAVLLRPGGLLLVQNRNDEKLLRQGQRFLPLSTRREGDQEWLFFRFLDLDPRRLTFHLVTFHRAGAEWHYRVSTTTHRPLPQEELETALRRAGFDEIVFYGSWQMEPFDPERSGDLVAVARRGG
ncbi:MAG: class I SAM-dependent methyltransferase [Chloroflexia bacterium]